MARASPHIPAHGRLELAQQVSALRARLLRGTSGPTVPASLVTPWELLRLAAIGDGTLGCVLVRLLAEEEDGTLRVPAEPARQLQMVEVALQRLGASHRASDLVVRAPDGRLVWLLPRADRSMVDGLGQRLAPLLDGSRFWHQDAYLRLRAEVGRTIVQARSIADLATLCHAAERQPLC